MVDDPSLVIGVFGDSVTYGAGLADRALAWPRLLEARLQAHFGGSSVRVVSGAVRASSADFAALCWDEIWGAEWRSPSGQGRAPPIQLAIIDYAYTSSPAQIAALIDRCAARRIPVIATLYCPHADWHIAWQAAAQERGEWQDARFGEQLWGGPGNVPAHADPHDRMTHVDYSGRRFVSKLDETRTAMQMRAWRNQSWMSDRVAGAELPACASARRASCPLRDAEPSATTPAATREAANRLALPALADALLDRVQRPII